MTWTYGARPQTSLVQVARAATVAMCVLGFSGIVAAQPPPATPAPEPPPEWDVQLGAAFVGTSGNSDTSSFGASFEAHRRWLLWQMDAVAGAVQTSSNDVQTAEQYFAGLRAKRKLTERISATSGIRFERDRLQGLDFRSLLDGGLAYILIRQPKWKLDGLTHHWRNCRLRTSHTRGSQQVCVQRVSRNRAALHLLSQLQ
jgi:putative salt-induced outer membrane protein YdiY